MPVLVFDGIQNPLKLKTAHARQDNQRKKATKLKHLLQMAYPSKSTRQEVDKLRKESADVREDLIADIIDFLEKEGIPFLQAPVEAKQQLGIVSEDGDTICYGANMMISMISWDHKEPVKTKCCIYHANEIWKRPSAGGGKWTGFKMVLASLLGNDHIPRLNKNGYESVKRIMNDLVALPDDES